MKGRLPSLRPRRLIAALKRRGFVERRQTGSHLFLAHPDRPGRPVPVPMPARELKRGTLVAILRQAGVTVEELRDLL